MSSIAFDIQQLYQTYFGSKPKVGALPQMTGEQPYQLPTAGKFGDLAPDGSVLRTLINGVEIWLPIMFKGLDTAKFKSGYYQLPYSTISISGDADWIRTPMNERRGKVKELYSINDYKVHIKGFFIDTATRQWPYSDLLALKNLFESGQGFRLDNALTNIYIPSEDNVVMAGFDLHPVQGKSNHVRPFSMELESDSIFVLEIE